MAIPPIPRIKKMMYIHKVDTAIMIAIVANLLKKIHLTWSVNLTGSINTTTHLKTTGKALISIAQVIMKNGRTLI